MTYLDGWDPPTPEDVNLDGNSSGLDVQQQRANPDSFGNQSADMGLAYGDSSYVGRTGSSADIADFTPGPLDDTAGGGGAGSVALSRLGSIDSGPGPARGGGSGGSSPARGGGGASATDLHALTAAARGGGGGASSTRSRELTRRIGMVNEWLPWLHQTDPTGVIRIARQAVNDADLAEAAKRLAIRTYGLEQVRQIKGYSEDLQRSQWKQMPVRVKAQLKHYGYEGPPEKQTPGWHVPGSGLLPGDGFDIGGGSDSSLIAKGANLVGATLHGWQGMITTPLGEALEQAQKPLNTLLGFGRAGQFREERGNLADTAAEIAFATYLRQHGYAEDGGMRVPGTSHGSNGIRDADHARELNVPPDVIQAAEEARDRAKAESLAVQDLVLGKDVSFMEDWDKALDGHRYLRPGVQLNMFRSVGEDKYAFNIAMHQVTDPNDTEWLTKLALAHGAYGTPEFARAQSRIARIVNRPGFKRAVDLAKDQEITMGKVFAKEWLRLKPGSKPFTVASGSFDAASILADPLILGGKATKSIRLARWAIDAEEGAARARGAAALATMSAEEIANKSSSSASFAQAIEAIRKAPAKRGIPALFSDGAAMKRSLAADRGMGAIAGALNDPTAGALMRLERRMGPKVNRLWGPLRAYERTLIAEEGHGIRNADDVWEFFQSADGSAALAAGVTNPTWAHAHAVLPTYTKLGAKELLRGAYVKPIDFSVDWGRQIIAAGRERGGLTGFGERLVGRSIAAPGHIASGLTLHMPRSMVLDADSPEGIADTKRSIYSWMSITGSNRAHADALMDELIRGPADLRAAAVSAAHPEEAARLWHQLRPMNEGTYRNLVMGYVRDLFTEKIVEMGIADPDVNKALEESVSRVFRKLQSYAPNEWDLHDGIPKAVFQAQTSTKFRLPDLRDFTKIIRRQSFTREMLAYANAEVVESAMRRFWKPAMLLRAGFIPRAGAEEALAFMARRGPKALIGSWVSQYAARGSYADELTEAKTYAERMARQDTVNRGRELGILGFEEAAPRTFEGGLAEHYDKRFRYHLNEKMPTAEAHLAKGWDKTELLPMRMAKASLAGGQKALDYRAISDGFRNRMAVKFGVGSEWAADVARRYGKGMRMAAGALVDARRLEAANYIMRSEMAQKALAERLGGSTWNIVDAPDAVDPGAIDQILFKDPDTNKYFATVDMSDRYLPKGTVSKAEVDPAVAYDGVRSTAQLMYAEPSLGAHAPGSPWEILGGAVTRPQADEGVARLRARGLLPPEERPPTVTGPGPGGGPLDPFAANNAATERARISIQMDPEGTGVSFDPEDMTPPDFAPPQVPGTDLGGATDMVDTPPDAANTAMGVADETGTQLYGEVDDPSLGQPAVPEEGTAAPEMEPGMTGGPNATAAEATADVAPDLTAPGPELPSGAPQSGAPTPPPSSAAALGREHLMERKADLQAQIEANRTAMTGANQSNIDALRRRQQELTDRMAQVDADLAVAERTDTVTPQAPTPVAEGPELQALHERYADLAERMDNLTGAERRAAEAEMGEVKAQLEASDPDFRDAASQNVESLNALNVRRGRATGTGATPEAPAAPEEAPMEHGPWEVTSTRLESDEAINDRIGRLRHEREAAVRAGASAESLSNFDDRIAAAVRERGRATPVEGGLFDPEQVPRTEYEPGSWEHEYQQNREERSRIAARRGQGWTDEVRDLDMRAHELRMQRNGGVAVPNPLLDEGRPVEEARLHGRTPHPVPDEPGDPLLDERTNEALEAWKAADAELHVNVWRHAESLDDPDLAERLLAQRYELLQARTEAYRRFTQQAMRMAREFAPPATSVGSAVASHVIDTDYVHTVAELVEAKGALTINRLNREQAALRGLTESVNRYDYQARALAERVDAARYRMIEMHGGNPLEAAQFYRRPTDFGEPMAETVTPADELPTPQRPEGYTATGGSMNDPHYRAALDRQEAEAQARAQSELQGNPTGNEGGLTAEWEPLQGAPDGNEGLTDEMPAGPVMEEGQAAYDPAQPTNIDPVPGNAPNVVPNFRIDEDVNLPDADLARLQGERQQILDRYGDQQLPLAEETRLDRIQGAIDDILGREHPVISNWPMRQGADINDLAAMSDAQLRSMGLSDSAINDLRLRPLDQRTTGPQANRDDWRAYIGVDQHSGAPIPPHPLRFFEEGHGYPDELDTERMVREGWTEEELQAWYEAETHYDEMLNVHGDDFGDASWDPEAGTPEHEMRGYDEHGNQEEDWRASAIPMPDEYRGDVPSYAHWRMQVGDDDLAPPRSEWMDEENHYEPDWTDPQNLTDEDLFQAGWTDTQIEDLNHRMAASDVARQNETLDRGERGVYGAYESTGLYPNQSDEWSHESGDYVRMEIEHGRWMHQQASEVLADHQVHIPAHDLSDDELFAQLHNLARYRYTTVDTGAGESFHIGSRVWELQREAQARELNLYNNIDDLPEPMTATEYYQHQNFPEVYGPLPGADLPDEMVSAADERIAQWTEQHPDWRNGPDLGHADDEDPYTYLEPDQMTLEDGVPMTPAPPPTRTALPGQERTANVMDEIDALLAEHPEIPEDRREHIVNIVFGREEPDATDLHDRDLLHDLDNLQDPSNFVGEEYTHWTDAQLNDAIERGFHDDEDMHLIREELANRQRSGEPRYNPYRDEGPSFGDTGQARRATRDFEAPDDLAGSWRTEVTEQQMSRVNQLRAMSDEELTAQGWTESEIADWHTIESRDSTTDRTLSQFVERVENTSVGEAGLPVAPEPSEAHQRLNQSLDDIRNDPDLYPPDWRGNQEEPDFSTAEEGTQAADRASEFHSGQGPYSHLDDDRLAESIDHAEELEHDGDLGARGRHTLEEMRAEQRRRQEIQHAEDTTLRGEQAPGAPGDAGYWDRVDAAGGGAPAYPNGIDAQEVEDAARTLRVDEISDLSDAELRRAFSSLPEDEPTTVAEAAHSKAVTDEYDARFGEAEAQAPPEGGTQAAHSDVANMNDDELAAEIARLREIGGGDAPGSLSASGHERLMRAEEERQSRVIRPGETMHERETRGMSEEQYGTYINRREEETRASAQAMSTADLESELAQMRNRDYAEEDDLFRGDILETELNRRHAGTADLEAQFAQPSAQPSEASGSRMHLVEQEANRADVRRFVQPIDEIIGQSDRFEGMDLDELLQGDPEGFNSVLEIAIRDSGNDDLYEAWQNLSHDHQQRVLQEVLHPSEITTDAHPGVINIGGHQMVDTTGIGGGGGARGLMYDDVRRMSSTQIMDQLGWPVEMHGALDELDTLYDRGMLDRAGANRKLAEMDDEAQDFLRQYPEAARRRDQYLSDMRHWLDHPSSDMPDWTEYTVHRRVPNYRGANVPSIEAESYVEARRRWMENRAAAHNARGLERARLDAHGDELAAHMEAASEALDHFDHPAAKHLKGAGAPPLPPGAGHFPGGPPPEGGGVGGPGDHDFIIAVRDYRTVVYQLTPEQRVALADVKEAGGISRWMAEDDLNTHATQMAHTRRATRTRETDLTSDEQRALHAITGAGHPMSISKRKIGNWLISDPKFRWAAEFQDALDGPLARVASGTDPLHITESTADLTKKVQDAGRARMLRPEVGGRYASMERMNQLSDGTMISSVPADDQIPVYGPMLSTRATDDFARRAAIARRGDGTYDVAGLAANLGFRDDQQMMRVLEGVDFDQVEANRAARLATGTQSAVDVPTGWVTTSYDDALNVTRRLADRLDGDTIGSVPGLFYADTRNKANIRSQDWQTWFHNADPKAGFTVPPGWRDQFTGDAVESILSGDQRAAITPLGLNGEEVTRMNVDGMISPNGQIAVQGGDWLRALDEMMALQAKTMIYNVSNTRGEILHDIVQPLREHGNILPGDVERLSIDDLPNQVLGKAKRLTADDAGRLPSRLIKRGWDKAVGPAITSIIRRPMFIDSYMAAYDEAQVMHRVLRSDRVEKVMDDLTTRLNGSQDVATLEGSLERLRDHRVTTLQDLDRAEHLGDEALRASHRDKAAELTEQIKTIEKRLDTARSGGAITRDHIEGWWNSMAPEDQRDWATYDLSKKRDLLEEVGAPPTPAFDVDAMNTIGDWATYKQNIADSTEAVAMQRAIDSMTPYIDDHRVRSVFADDARNVIPFMFAEEQFLKRWARTFIASPDVLRKGQLMMNGMRTVGFVHKDPESGHDMFVYPGSREIMSLLAGSAMGKTIFGDISQPVIQPLSGDLQFLLPGVVNPGQMSLGPLVSVPLNAAASWFPEMKYARDEILGRQVNESIWNQLTPPWARNIWKGANPSLNDQSITSTVIDQIKLQSYRAEVNRHRAQIAERQGDHKKAARLNDEADELAPPLDADAITIKRFTDRVTKFVKGQYVMRGILGFLSPGQSPGVDYPKELDHEYRALLTNMPPDQALDEFLHRHPDATPYTVFKTESPSKAYISPTKEAFDFLEANPELVHNYPMGGAWLLPQNKGEGDPDAFHAEISAGLRQYRGAVEWEKQYHYARVARPYFDDKRRKDAALNDAAVKGDDATESAIRASWSARSKWYSTTFPLFAEMLTSPSRRIARAQVLSELRLALQDPGVPETDQSEDLRTVISALDTYMDAKVAIGPSTTDAANSRRAELKQQLERWGERYVMKNPRVAAFWQAVVAPTAGVSGRSEEDD